MNTLFTLSFWFSKYPQALTPTFEKIFFILFAAVLLAGVVLRIVLNQRQRDHFATVIHQSITTLLMTMGGLGLVWFFFTYQQIPLIGARFWFLLWVIGLLAWAGWIARYAYKTVPQLKEEQHQRQERMKYFPPRKKKKNKKIRK